MVKLTPELLVDSKCELGEGPIWDPRCNKLLSLDILHSKIFLFDPVTGVNEMHDLSAHTSSIGTIVPAQGGSTSQVVLGVAKGFALYDFETKAFEDHPSNGSLHSEFTRMNDGKCDPQGRFWLGSVSRTGPGGADLVMGGASLYVLETWAGAPTKILDGVTVSNGLDWSVDGKTMYYTDSLTFGVDAFDFDGGASSHVALATNRRRAVDVSTGFPPVPDGCALDTQGKLWVACFGVGEVRRYDPAAGTLLATVVLPAEAGTEATACAFGGEALDELYITTAHEFWDAEKQAKMPIAGGLFKVSRATLATLGPGIAGVPMHHFKV